MLMLHGVHVPAHLQAYASLGCWLLLHACHLGPRLQHQALAMVKHTPALAKVELCPCPQAQVMLRVTDGVHIIRKYPCVCASICTCLSYSASVAFGMETGCSNTHTMCSYCACTSMYVQVSVKALVGITLRCN